LGNSSATSARSSRCCSTSSPTRSSSPGGGGIALSTHRREGTVEVAVSDTGIGIAPEDRAAIFEEFRQVGSDEGRNQEGTGLGLTLAKKFIELHGGRIWVESQPGRGSTFTFTLPVG
jgi:signal transduction histidine kinase